MTRHRRRPARLIHPARTVALTILVLASLGLMFVWPARSPDREPSANRAGFATTQPKGTPTPTLLASPGPEPTPTPSPPATTPDERARMEDEAIALANVERSDAGCPPLRADDRLRDAARGHSEDMAERGYFSHISPDGRTPWERAAAAGYGSPSAENIARGFADAQSVIEAWMDSEGHRDNILNCASLAVGVGVELDGAGAPYWTQMFGYE